jgi:spore germination protein GerM
MFVFVLPGLTVAGHHGSYVVQTFTVHQGPRLAQPITSALRVTFVGPSASSLLVTCVTYGMHLLSPQRHAH